MVLHKRKYVRPQKSQRFYTYASIQIDSPAAQAYKKAPPKECFLHQNFMSSDYLPNWASIVPAATAVPITPATFGPIACMSR